MGEVKLRTIALPKEHGGWGLILEPVLAGLCIAPGLPGFLTALAALTVFLLDNPLKILIRDKTEGVELSRTRWARMVVFGYSVILIFCLAGILHLSRGPFWIPLLAAIPFAVVQLGYVLAKKHRHLVRQLCGAVALSATVAVILTAGGISLERAIAVWIILAVRGISSIIFVRERLRALRREVFSPASVVTVFAAGFMVLLLLALSGSGDWMIAVAFGILFLRAVLEIFRISPDTTIEPRTVGFREMRAGIIYSLFVAARYWF